MGWTGTYRYPYESVDQFFEREFKGWEFVGKGALVRMKEYYRAVHIPAEKSKDGKEHYFCLVCLVHFERGESNMNYKDMTEDELPYYFNCPERVLKIVERDNLEDETKYPKDEKRENAIKWRKECRRKLARRKETRKLEDGAVIKFPREFNFGSFKEDTFIVQKRGWGRRKTKHLVSKSTGYSVRIPEWEGTEYEVISK